MNKHLIAWTVPVTGGLLLAAAVPAENPPPLTKAADNYLTATNRVALSLRLGFNIHGKFKGIGSTFAPGAPLRNPRFTPDGDRYNYDNGYALPDVSGSGDGRTWYWGYDSVGQIGASGADSLDLSRTEAVGLPGDRSRDDSPYLGAELTYNYEIGKDEWRKLYYGVEVGLSFMPIDFGGRSSSNLELTSYTDTYTYGPGLTPPGATLPYQGSFSGPGMVINYPRANRVINGATTATFIAQQSFEGNLWGLRLGPYVDWLPAEKWTIHVSGGLALGLLNGSAKWSETLTLPGGGPGDSTTLSGRGSDTALLWGYFVGVDARYQFNERWGAQVGVQLQDLGVYGHNFGGRRAEIDFSEAIFVSLGVNYSF